MPGYRSALPLPREVHSRVAFSLKVVKYLILFQFNETVSTDHILKILTENSKELCYILYGLQNRTYHAEPCERLALLDVLLSEVERRVVAYERVPVPVVVVVHDVHEIQVPVGEDGVLCCYVSRRDR